MDPHMIIKSIFHILNKHLYNLKHFLQIQLYLIYIVLNYLIFPSMHRTELALYMEILFLKEERLISLLILFLLKMFLF